MALEQSLCRHSEPQQSARVASTPSGHGVDSASASDDQHLDDEFDAEDVRTTAASSGNVTYHHTGPSVLTIARSYYSMSRFHTQRRV